MIARSYHPSVPDTVKIVLEKEFSVVNTFGHFLERVSQLKEPIQSTVARPSLLLLNPLFLIEGKPNWRVVNTFKKKYEIRRGVRLPLANDTELDESAVWTLRSVVTKSSDYRALMESFPLQCEAQKNGYGPSSYACVLYIFDILAEGAIRAK